VEGFLKNKLTTSKTKSKLKKYLFKELCIKSGLINEVDLAKLYGQEIDVPFIEIDPSAVSISVLKRLSEEISEQYSAVVFDTENGALKVALEDPDDVQATNFFKKNWALI
jgi:hypothetical protein